MSAVNRVGLGILLMLLVFVGMVIAEMDLWVTFSFGVITMVGYVLFVYEEKQDEA